MGKLKEAMINEHETDNYLTMARIMARKLEQYEKENFAHNWTGFERLYAKAAFKAGYIEGFSFRFEGEL
jgi:hypothetical protein